MGRQGGVECARGGVAAVLGRRRRVEGRGGGQVDLVQRVRLGQRRGRRPRRRGLGGRRGLARHPVERRGNQDQYQQGGEQGFHRVEREWGGQNWSGGEESATCNYRARSAARFAAHSRRKRVRAPSLSNSPPSARGTCCQR